MGVLLNTDLSALVSLWASSCCSAGITNHTHQMAMHMHLRTHTHTNTDHTSDLRVQHFQTKLRGMKSPTLFVSIGVWYTYICVWAISVVCIVCVCVSIMSGIFVVNFIVILSSNVNNSINPWPPQLVDGLRPWANEYEPQTVFQAVLDWQNLFCYC